MQARVEQFGEVYGWCVQDYLAAVRKWCERHRHADPIQWVFEAGLRDMAKLTRCSRKSQNEKNGK
jgi:hypothetical protein